MDGWVEVAWGGFVGWKIGSLGGRWEDDYIDYGVRSYIDEKDG